MQTSDVMMRISGAMMLMSSLWNGVLSFVWFICLVWFCVGALWLIPLLGAVLYFIAGIMAVAMGDKARVVAFAPIMGILISICNFNIMGAMIDTVALILGIVGFTSYDPNAS